MNLHLVVGMDGSFSYTAKDDYPYALDREVVIDRNRSPL
ncbi:MAG: hypothetical protein A4E42_02136 [Methanoregulaceae archaeon PtaU1.Bin222]|nr:MAG: hypothetical protein A4E42_02136 [Methanoregulaceae archaeon PtaU1.Bin222]